MTQPPAPWPAHYIPPRPPLMAHEVIERVAWFYETTREEIVGRSMHRHLVHARWAVTFALRQRGWSRPRIARLLHKDQSTITYADGQTPAARLRFEEFDDACRVAVGQLA